MTTLMADRRRGSGRRGAGVGLDALHPVASRLAIHRRGLVEGHLCGLRGKHLKAVCGELSGHDLDAWEIRQRKGERRFQRCSIHSLSLSSRLGGGRGAARARAAGVRVVGAQEEVSSHEDPQALFHRSSRKSRSTAHARGGVGRGALGARGGARRMLVTNQEKGLWNPSRRSGTRRGAR